MQQVLFGFKENEKHQTSLWNWWENGIPVEVLAVKAQVVKVAGHREFWDLPITGNLKKQTGTKCSVTQLNPYHYACYFFPIACPSPSF
jgi:hypothetical protein